ncbi:LysM peptidoglycan-binding domain-containing protein [Roseibacterium beibuensis]|uniref:LysM peptidoglycan-binding domain-containing protein n=1 Tax=[Roseibacterium] beibuensis TaxID=1193142 RepID=A0ABP9L3U4_9RHOB|nr:LysM peptidoglycan-binding domain-containing protein [Roseibacterium beibuensis]MCS6621336.1 LysM peptidoglycan-binding domain-containing protein [Roseibacterium beibuensis]
MKLGAVFGTSRPAVGAAAGAVVLLVAGVVGYGLIRGDDDTPPAQDPPPVAEVTPEPDVTAEAPEAEAPAPEAPAPADPPEAQASVAPPSFDQVRVAPDGATVIAGRAPAGADVQLLLDGVSVAETPADASGSFAMLLTLPPADAPRILSLMARLDGAEIAGAEQVIVAPFGAPEAMAAATPGTVPAPPGGDEAAPEAEGDPVDAAPETDIALAGTPDAAATVPDEPASAATSPGPDAPAALAGAPATATPTEPAAPSVIIAGPGGVRVAQGGTPPPAAQTEVRLDAISYDTEGDVILSGRGAAEAQLQVFLDNQPIRLGEVGPSGNWSLDLPEIDPGTYTLRVTELSPHGDVTSEVETPFLREDPARVAAAPLMIGGGVSVMTVQPGFTLWGIAEENFGDGLAYVQIFEENRDQIQDPNWIFPGQIFRLPDLPVSQGAPDEG